MAEYSVFIQYDPIDNIFIASIPELPGCMADGKTKEEALKEIEVVRDMWIECALQDGEKIPEPSLYTTV